MAARTLAGRLLGLLLCVRVASGEYADVDLASADDDLAGLSPEGYLGRIVDKRRQRSRPGGALAPDELLGPSKAGSELALEKSAVGVSDHHPCHAPGPAPTTLAPTPAPPVVAGDYKLLTYNVLYNNRRFWDMAGVIKNVVDPDIVNLQEAIKGMPEQIVEKLNALGGGEWKLANPWDRKYFWCGLTAYRSDKWDLLWHKELGIQQSNDQRGLCGALLKRKIDGTKLCVFGAHPVWRNMGDKRWAMDIVQKGADMMK